MHPQDRIGLRLRIDSYVFPIRAAPSNGKDLKKAVREALATPLPQGMQQTGVREIVQPTEAGEAIKLLNNDATDPTTRQSAIDFNARLREVEGASVLAVDVLVGMGGLTQRCAILSRQKKRLSVSRDGKGRGEIVSLFVGKKEQDAKAGQMGIFDRAKAYFGGG